MKRIYVAGPYTHGDVAVNVKVAIEAGLSLIQRGYAPFIPHLFHFVHMQSPQPYKTWTDIDLSFVETCDGLLRLSGHSPGADVEVGHATRMGIPVYTNLNELP